MMTSKGLEEIIQGDFAGMFIKEFLPMLTGGQEDPSRERRKVRAGYSPGRWEESRK
jgi:hypothetical protein